MAGVKGLEPLQIVLETIVLSLHQTPMVEGRFIIESFLPLPLLAEQTGLEPAHQSLDY